MTGSRNAHYWLMKSEPEVYSIEDLQRDGATLWTGVRNYQARNYMLGREQTANLVKLAELEKKKLAPSMTAAEPLTMEAGERFLFYHSNAAPSPACVGVGRISKVGIPDSEQFNKKSDGYEPKATKEKPMWFCAEVTFEKTFTSPVSLERIRTEPSLASMVLLQKGSRLSIQPVSEVEFLRIEKLGLLRERPK